MKALIHSTASKEYSFKHSKWIHDKFFKKPGILIDLGAGEGLYSDAFEKLGYKVYRLIIIIKWIT